MTALLLTPQAFHCPGCSQQRRVICTACRTCAECCPCDRPTAPTVAHAAPSSATTQALALDFELLEDEDDELAGGAL